MIHFTQQERHVIIFVSVTIFIGLFLDLSGKGYWSGVSWLHILDEPSFYPRLNVNRASFEDLLSVPRMNPAAARLILEYRTAHGRIQNLEELAGALGLQENCWARLSRHLKVR